MKKLSFSAQLRLLIPSVIVLVVSLLVGCGGFYLLGYLEDNYDKSRIYTLEGEVIKVSLTGNAGNDSVDTIEKIRLENGDIYEHNSGGNGTYKKGDILTVYTEGDGEYELSEALLIDRHYTFVLVLACIGCGSTILVIPVYMYNYKKYLSKEKDK